MELQLNGVAGGVDPKLTPIPHWDPPATLALVFLLLFFNFRNVSETLIVMLSIPFTLIGGIWLLWALDYNWSVAVTIGFLRNLLRERIS